ncbi:MAG TPA: hypothetical protein VHC19_09950, partial [Pirellulales bacterium]|nr:hypothetical protein [Pirellulales bacterium]
MPIQHEPTTRRGSQRRSRRDRGAGPAPGQAPPKTRRCKRAGGARGAATTESTESLMEVSGVLELLPKGYGFLRAPGQGYAQQRSDAYVPQRLADKYKLRAGSLVSGRAQRVRDSEGPRLVEISEIDRRAPEDSRSA